MPKFAASMPALIHAISAGCVFGKVTSNKMCHMSLSMFIFSFVFLPTEIQKYDFLDYTWAGISSSVSKV